jgi:predicted transcriptional regulator
MSALKDVLARAEHWTATAQDRLVQAALEIEQTQDQEFELTEEDWKIIDQRVAASARGEFATDQEVEAIFNKYRLP